MANAQDRRAAQRKIAQQIKSGEYQKTRAGAKARRVAAARRTPVKTIGFQDQRSREFTRLDDVWTFAHALPPGSVATVVARGELANPENYNSADVKWLRVSDFFDPSSFPQRMRDQVMANKERLFTGRVTYALVWQ